MCPAAAQANSSYAYHIEGKTCTVFNQTKITAEEIPKKTDGSKESTSQGGIALTYSVEGSACAPNGGAEKLMKISLFCNEGATQLKFLNQNFYKEKCMMELQYESANGCPAMKGSQIGKFIEDHKIPIAVSLIIGGICLAFFGKYAINTVIFIVGGLCIAFALCYVSLSIIYKK